MSISLPPTYDYKNWDSNQIGDKNAEELFNKTAKETVCSKSKRKGRMDSNKRKCDRDRRNVKINTNRHKANKSSYNKTEFRQTGLMRNGRSLTAVRTKNNMREASSNPKISSISEENANVISKRKVKKINKLKKLSEVKSIPLIINKANIEPECSDINIGNKIQKRKTKLMKLLNSVPSVVSTKARNMSLRERMLEKLKASRFRYINQQMYSSESPEIENFFKNDPDAFQAYHEGYRQQVSKWPLNPLDIITESIKHMPKDYVVADMGCGEGRLAQVVSQKVHSFDLVAANKHVTACDMRHVPLQNESVDIVVFCLSLMGTNIKEYLFEANRILKNGGLLKIADVESRFDTVDVFIEGVKRFGFTSTWKDLSQQLFYFLDFKKSFKCKSLHKLPTIGLLPCLYKKR